MLAQADADAREQVAAAGATHVVELQEPLSFGEAVRAGERVLEAPGVRRRRALAPRRGLRARARRARRAARHARDRRSPSPSPVRSSWSGTSPTASPTFGRTITRLGRSVPIVADELDQGQHDGLSDVLGLDPAAILVRHSVWQSLDGFDPALPDRRRRASTSACARASPGTASRSCPRRGCGSRPTASRARPATGGRGRVAGNTRAARAAALHRRLVVRAGAGRAVPLAELPARSRIAPLDPAPAREAAGRDPRASSPRRSPRCSPGVRVARARRIAEVRRARSGWSAIAPLRHAARRGAPATPGRRGGAAHPRARAHARAAVHRHGRRLGAARDRRGIRRAVLLAHRLGRRRRRRTAAAVGHSPSSGATPPTAGATSAPGSSARPTRSPACSRCSARSRSGRRRSRIVLLWLVAMPAAAIGVWFAASRLTERGSLRAVAALALGGRAAVPHRARRGPPRRGARARPARLARVRRVRRGDVVGGGGHRLAAVRRRHRRGAEPRARPHRRLDRRARRERPRGGAARRPADPRPRARRCRSSSSSSDAARRSGSSPTRACPSAARCRRPGSSRSACPSGGWGGWDELVPVDDVARSASRRHRARRAARARRARLGVRARHGAAPCSPSAPCCSASPPRSRPRSSSVAIVGPEVVPVWAGAGLSLAWLGLVLAAVVGARRAPARRRPLIGAVVVVVSLVAVVPLSFAIATDAVPLAPASERTLPAYVVAQAEADPRVTTLRMEPEPDGGLRATLEHGTGTTLDDQSTLDADPDGADRRRGAARRRSRATSRRAADSIPRRPCASSGPRSCCSRRRPTTAARPMQTEARARTALDGNAALVAVGETDFGTLWRFAAAEPDAAAAQIPADAGGWLAGLITTIQVIVIGAALLLSIPTGAGREADRRSPRRTTRRRRCGRRGVPALPPGPSRERCAERTAMTAAGAEAAEPAERGRRIRRRSTSRRAGVSRRTRARPTAPVDGRASHERPMARRRPAASVDD